MRCRGGPNGSDQAEAINHSGGEKPKGVHMTQDTKGVYDPVQELAFINLGRKRARSGGRKNQ